MSQIEPYQQHPVQQQASGYQQQPTSWHTPLLTDRREPDTAVVVIAWVVAVLTLGYMLPWAVAATRGTSNQGPVALVNLLLGWSFVGWVVALVMACQAHRVVAAPGSVNLVVAQQFPQAHFAGPVPVPHAGPAAGWYPAPEGIGQRYWDGVAWTAHTAP